MITALVLALPDFTIEFTMESDASNSRIGVVLTHEGNPVAYFNKAFSRKHQTLSVYDKEMMAILVAMKKWSSYLVGLHFKIKTDHQSLKFLLDQKSSTPTQHQWILKMMGFDYEVVYRKRTFNEATDALSRRPKGYLMLSPLSKLICLKGSKIPRQLILPWYN